MNEEKSGVNFANNDLQPEKFLPSRSLQPHVQPCKLKIRHASLLHVLPNPDARSKEHGKF